MTEVSAVHTRIMQIAEQTYRDHLEFAACLKVIFPARKLLLDNVQHEKRPRGSHKGHYSCIFDYDVIVDDDCSETFVHFLQCGWSLHHSHDEGSDYSIALESPLQKDGAQLSIHLDNFDQRQKSHYLMSAVNYKYSHTKKSLLISEDDERPLSIELDGYGIDSAIISAGGLDLTLQLIETEYRLITSLTAQLL